MQSRKPDFLDASDLRRGIVDLLSRRDYSRLELLRKFRDRCEDSDQLEQILDDFQQRQWQSDLRFAESYLNSRFQRGIGPLRLRQELREKGIDSHTIELVFDAFDGDWFENLYRIAEKKSKSIKENDKNKKQKLFRFLAYRGFTSEQISSVIDDL